MQIKINKYDVVETGRYNCNFQLKLGKLGKKDGKFYQYFMSIKKQDGSQQTIPVTLTFDSDDDAKSFFKKCYEAIETKTEDVPF